MKSENKRLWRRRRAIVIVREHVRSAVKCAIRDVQARIGDDQTARDVQANQMDGRRAWQELEFCLHMN